MVIGTEKKSAPGTPKRHRTSLSAATGEVLTRFTRRRPSDLGQREYRGEEREMVGGRTGAQARGGRARRREGARAHRGEGAQGRGREGARALRKDIVPGGGVATSSSFSPSASAPVRQCASAPVRQCASAPVRHCASAPVRQCAGAPVR